MIFQLSIFLSAFILFFILSPGVLLRLPPKGDKFTVAFVHAIVFSILFGILSKQFNNMKEGVTIKCPPCDCNKANKALNKEQHVVCDPTTSEKQASFTPLKI